MLPNLTIGGHNSNESSSRFLYMCQNWQTKCDIYVEMLKAKNHLNNPEEEESWTHSDVKTYYKAMFIKTVEIAIKIE